jgi:hypothetical protein
MDKRREPRFEADQAVTLTVLGDCPSKQPAIVRNASSRGLAIEVSHWIPPGSALKIEFDDSVVLGEAVYCRNGTGKHLVGVELDQVLCGLTELGRKLQEFSEEECLGPVERRP